MKLSFSFVFLGLLAAGCSNTTYLSLTEDDKGKVRHELNAYEKEKNVGAEVVFLLNNGKEIEGELLSVRDGAMIVCTEYSATEEELANSKSPVILVKNNMIRKMTLEGSNYFWIGLGVGYLTGTLLGNRIGQSSEHDKGLATLGGMFIGGFLGSIAGGITGYALSKEEFILQEIPPGYNFNFLKNLARYVEKEPAYLKTIVQD